jgi:LysM repeat protein
MPTIPTYTVQSGDTLSSIAKKYGVNIGNITGYRSGNPNLIYPGEKLTLGNTAPVSNVQNNVGTTLPSKPAINTGGGYWTEGKIDPITNTNIGGGVFVPGPPPNVPTAPATVPAVDNVQNTQVGNVPAPTATDDDVLKKLLSAFTPTATETDLQKKLTNLEASRRLSFQNLEGQPIATPFITGQESAVSRQIENEKQTLASELSLEQAKRQSAIEATKAALEYNKPVSLSVGQTLVNPRTGKTIAGSSISMNDKQAMDTFYNLAQTYPDAGIRYDPSKSWQDNLITAQNEASQSPYFKARQTALSTNPLTGEPTLVYKGAGTGTVFGTQTPVSGLTGTQPTGIEAIPSQLRPAVQDLGGIQFIDQSKLTPGQITYAQRASEASGIPLLSEKDSDAIQTTYAAFLSADSLVQQIEDLTADVITASNNPSDMTRQLAYLNAIKKAPTLFTDDKAKGFISARDSVVSIISKALGEKGTLTDYDIDRVREALPSYGDNKELALQKSRNLSQALSSVYIGSVKAYLGRQKNVSGNITNDSASEYTRYLQSIGIINK